MHTPQPITHMTLRLIKNWPQFLQYWMIYSPCCSPSIHRSILLPSLFVPPAECCNWSAAFFLTEMLQVVGGSVYKDPGAINALHRHPPGKGSHQPGLLARWSGSKHLHHTHWICQRNLCFSHGLDLKGGFFWGAAPLPQETKRKKVSWPTGRRSTPSCVETENRSLLPVGSQERSISGCVLQDSEHLELEMEAVRM